MSNVRDLITSFSHLSYILEELDAVTRVRMNREMSGDIRIYILTNLHSQTDSNNFLPT